MLHINNPQYADERSESKPLSLDEQENVVDIIEYLLTKLEEKTKFTLKTERKNLQSLLYHYENLQALSDFIGGWEGAYRLNAEWVTFDDILPTDGERIMVYDSENECIIDNTTFHNDGEEEKYIYVHDLGSYSLDKGNFTHWRPLPPKPLVKDKD